MLEVAAAREIVLGHARRRPAEPTAVTPDALGRVLAADVPSDIDSPPFDKAMMDGYAVRAADTPPGATLAVVAEIAAGDFPTLTVGPGQAARILTGAPLPPGADAVAVQERCERTGDAVRIDVPVAAGMHVMPRGREMLAGDVVLPAGTVLSAATFGLLAAVGRTTVSAYPAPKVAVLATGSELVEADTRPGPGQIRNSNGPMLVAQAARAGAVPRYLGIARDDWAVLTSLVTEGLNAADVLVVAGGVSVGDKDLVPEVLTSLGVETRFHSVRMKPGKPLLFGTRGSTLVFGLPGNPVSAFVGFELFVEPALRVLAGHPVPGPRELALTLSEPLAADNNRPTYHPAKREPGGRVRGLAWFGSPDLRALADADALLVLPPGKLDLPAGSPVTAIPIRRTANDVA